MHSVIPKRALLLPTVFLAATAEDGIHAIPERPNALDENGGLRGARNHLRPDLSSSAYIPIDDQDVVMDDDDLSLYDSFDQLHFAKSLDFVLWDDEDSPDYSQGSSGSSSMSSRQSSTSMSSESNSKKSSNAPATTPALIETSTPFGAPTSAPSLER